MYLQSIVLICFNRKLLTRVSFLLLLNTLWRWQSKNVTIPTRLPSSFCLPKKKSFTSRILLKLNIKRIKDYANILTSSDVENVEYYNSNIILSPTEKLSREEKKKKLPSNTKDRRTTKAHFRVCTIENAHISSEKREKDDEADFSQKTLSIPLCKQRISKTHLNGWKGKNQHFWVLTWRPLNAHVFDSFTPFRDFSFLCVRGWG